MAVKDTGTEADVGRFQLSRLAKLLDSPQPESALETKLLTHAIYALVLACQQAGVGKIAQAMLAAPASRKSLVSTQN